MWGKTERFYKRSQKLHAFTQSYQLLTFYHMYHIVSFLSLSPHTVLFLKHLRVPYIIVLFALNISLYVF